MDLLTHCHAQRESVLLRGLLGDGLISQLQPFKSLSPRRMTVPKIYVDVAMDIKWLVNRS